jgi:hypothetical protein
MNRTIPDMTHAAGKQEAEIAKRYSALRNHEIGVLRKFPAG